MLCAVVFVVLLSVFDIEGLPQVEFSGLGYNQFSKNSLSGISSFGKERRSLLNDESAGGESSEATSETSQKPFPGVDFSQYVPDAIKKPWSGIPGFEKKERRSLLNNESAGGESSEASSGNPQKPFPGVDFSQYVPDSIKKPWSGIPGFEKKERRSLLNDESAGGESSEASSGNPQKPFPGVDFSQYVPDSIKKPWSGIPGFEKKERRSLLNDESAGGESSEASSGNPQKPFPGVDFSQYVPDSIKKPWSGIPGFEKKERRSLLNDESAGGESSEASSETSQKPFPGVDFSQYVPDSIKKPWSGVPGFEKKERRSLLNDESAGGESSEASSGNPQKPFPGVDFSQYVPDSIKKPWNGLPGFEKKERRSLLNDESAGGESSEASSGNPQKPFPGVDFSQYVPDSIKKPWSGVPGFENKEQW